VKSANGKMLMKILKNTAQTENPEESLSTGENKRKKEKLKTTS
jgi:hypothetical protein